MLDLSLRNFPSVDFEPVPTIALPFLILSRKIVESSFYSSSFFSHSPPGDWQCNVLGFVPTASVSISGINLEAST